jgi:DNA-binding response OmpR family regulator
MKLKGKEAGAKAWLIKPFQPETLIEAVRKFIQ